MSHFAVALITTPDGRSTPAMLHYAVIDYLRTQQGVEVISAPIADEEAQKMIDHASMSVMLADGLDGPKLEEGMQG